MFGASRRQRAPVQPLTKETANPNAATAAASAFMRREPAPSLSSAAAAAALKARPITPTNVAEVQTKRTHRRTPSVSSTGSRDRSATRDLRRSPSVGSMTERTFRSPSPGRGPAPPQQHVPPVPSIPQEQQRTQEHRSTVAENRKSAPVQTQVFRTASQKQKDGKQGSSWFGAAAAGDPNNVRTSDLPIYSHKTAPEGRPGSISPSINFSYPRGSFDSPSGHQRASSVSDVSGPALVYDANSRRMVPRVDLVDRSGSVREPMGKPAKKKKHEASRSGSHFAKGTVGRTKTAILDVPTPAESRSTATPSPIPVVDTQTSSKATHAQAEQEDDLIERPVETAEHTREVEPRATQTTAQDFAQPHEPVPREPEPESEPEESDLEEHDEEPERLMEPAVAVTAAAATVAAAAAARVHSPPRRSESDASTLVHQSSTSEKTQTPETRQVEATRRTRVHSESPNRTPHFAPTTDQMLVRHEPPPRSTSPRKSALKQSSPPRGVSASEDESDSSRPGSGMNNRKDALTARKKAVRVSFDDNNTTVIGESATHADTDATMLPSPQAKKPWHSIVSRIGRKEQSSLEEDETMTPRPALPLFGSVREKKTKEPEERPLVRPSERTWSPPPAAALLRQGNQENASPELGQSNDAAIGSILSQEQSSRNAANISKFREPLPPVVTSVEGSGEHSDSFMSSDEESADEDMTQPVEDEEQSGDMSHEIANASDSDEVANTHKADQAEVAALQTDEKIPVAADETGEAVPPVVVTQPSEEVEVKEPPPKPVAAFFGVPGGFPEDEESSAEESDDTPEPANNPERMEPKSAGKAPPVTPTRPTTNLAEVTPSSQMADIEEEEEEDSSRDSIYSDAYEDLSETEGDGFLSLDAVLDTPLDTPLGTPAKDQATKNLQKKLVAETKEHHKDTMSTTATGEPAGTSTIGDQGVSVNDWDRAKAYWRSLSLDKRRQLEKEAAEEAADEADVAKEQKPKKKSKKKASILKTTQHEDGRHPDRIYQIQPGTAWSDSVDDTASQNTSRRGTGSKGFAGGKTLRKSTAEPSRPQPAGSGMRKSLRSAAPEPAPVTATSGGGLRKSMRPTTSAGDGDAQSRAARNAVRPASYHPGLTLDTSKSAKRSLSADGQPSPNALAGGKFKPSLRRRGSDSSESSFTRARPTSSGGFGFRRTMRSNAQPVNQPAEVARPGSSRFSLRSLSPTGSALQRNSISEHQSSPAFGGKMRQSLRSGGNAPDTSRKRFSGLGLTSGKKNKKPAAGTRFDDSSEDEGGSRPAFMSRFVDSSDEEDAGVPETKTNGLPKTMRNKPATQAAPAAPAASAAIGTATIDRSKSPQLPDEDYNIPQPKRGDSYVGSATSSRADGSLQRSRSGRGTIAPATSPGTIGTQGVGATRPDHKRRGSFMSSILRRKKDTGKISREVSESAARRDTKLERSTEQLTVMRSNSNSRLQKRDPSWPLPDNTANDDNEIGTAVERPKLQRPATSAGPSAASATPRASFKARRSLSHEVSVPPLPTTLGESNLGAAADDDESLEPQQQQQLQQPKKKKFGALRKMFKLND